MLDRLPLDWGDKMTFEYESYKNHLFWEPLSGIVIAILLVFFVIYKLHRIKSFRNIEIKLYLISVIGLILVISIGYICFLSLKFGIYLVYEDERDVIVYSGRIMSIEEQFYMRGYDEESGTTNCFILIISDEEFIFTTAEGLKIGDNVVVEYLPQSRVVLIWQHDLE